MKIRWCTVSAVSLLAVVARPEDDKALLKDQKDKFSYSLGVDIGNYIKRMETEANLDLLVRGVKDTLAGNPPLLSSNEVRQAMAAIQRDFRTKQEEKRKLQGQKNKEEGVKFLAENKNQPGVITLPSGLEYKIIAEGAGEPPKSNDVVTVNYRGTLIDGTEFDSSLKRGKPATFAVMGVVKGWSEALQLMKPGAKWQLFIPSTLAYGEAGRPPSIGPNAALIFEVELVSAKSSAAPAAVTSQPVTSDIIKVPSKEELEKGAKIEVIKASDLERLQKEKQLQDKSQEKN
jgi:FKBP-type peptidyl-prolyl cis-trans isomerase FklB